MNYPTTITRCLDLHKKSTASASNRDMSLTFNPIIVSEPLCRIVIVKVPDGLQEVV